MNFSFIHADHLRVQISQIPEEFELKSTHLLIITPLLCHYLATISFCAFQLASVAAYFY